VVEASELDTCPECNGKLGHPFRIRRRTVEELGNPQPVEVIEYEEFYYHCPTCDSEIIAKHRDCPPEGRMGKNVCIQTTLMKFDERLPERKIQSVLERQGLTITPATVLDIHRRVSQWLKPEYEEVLSNVRRSDVVHTDQTGIGVDGTNHWIWDFVTNSGTLIAIRKTKGKKVLEEILGKDWSGTIVCDGSRSHHSFAKDHPEVSIQRCWAHLLTEADELAERTEEARPLAEGLHRIYDRLKKALEKEPPPDERKRLARNAKRTLKRWIEEPYKRKRIQKFIAKIRNGFDCWFTFVIKPGVEPTNNRAELALREIVVQRKIIGTLRNQKGTSIYETMMTLLTTWKQRGLNLREALSASLSRAWARASIKRS
jgi:transposase